MSQETLQHPDIEEPNVEEPVEEPVDFSQDDEALDTPPQTGTEDAGGLLKRTRILAQTEGPLEAAKGLLTGAKVTELQVVRAAARTAAIKRDKNRPKNPGIGIASRAAWAARQGEETDSQPRRK